MKYRKDFVTNSSSSSYICEICGNCESGYDVGLSEFGMSECVNGHIFCDEHKLSITETKEDLIKSILENEYNHSTEEELNDMDIEELFNKKYDGGHYEIPEYMCPICQFIEYSESDLAQYLLKEYQVSRDAVFAEVKKFNKRRKKLYDSEYITYVCQQYNLIPAEIVSSWKDKFGTYDNFKTYLNSHEN